MGIKIPTSSPSGSDKNQTEIIKPTPKDGFISIDDSIAQELKDVLDKLESISIDSLALKWAVRRIKESIDANLPEWKHIELKKLLHDLRNTLDSNSSSVTESLLSYVEKLELLYTREKAQQTVIKKETQEKTDKEKFSKMVEEIESIYLYSNIDIQWKSWEDLTSEALEGIDMSPEEEKIFKKYMLPYKKYFDMLQQNTLDLSGINNSLDYMASQLRDKKDNDDGSVTVTASGSWILSNGLTLFADLQKSIIGKSYLWDSDSFVVSDTEITFPNKEVGLQMILEMKNYLDGLQNIDWGEFFLNKIWEWALWTISALASLNIEVLNLILADITTISNTFEWSLSSFIIWWTLLWLNLYGWVKFVELLKEANDGISGDRIRSIISGLKRQVELYEEAWFKENEIAHLKNVIESIESSLPEWPNLETKDRIRIMKRTYKMLQRHRGNLPSDFINTIASGFWDYLDGSLLWWSLIPRSVQDSKFYQKWARENERDPSFWYRLAHWRIATAANFTIRGFTLPLSLWNKFINRSPQWPIFWWGLQTKSRSLLHNDDSIKVSNEKMTLIFSLIDDLDSSSSDKEKIKWEIMREYQGIIPTAKFDSLRDFKLTWENLSDEQKAYFEEITMWIEEKRNLIMSRIKSDVKSLWKNKNEIPSVISYMFEKDTATWSRNGIKLVKEISYSSLQLILNYFPVNKRDFYTKTLNPKNIDIQKIWSSFKSLPSDTRIGIQKAILYMPRLRRIDDISANILEKFILNRTWSHPDIKGKIKQLREAGKSHEKNKLAIEKMQGKYSNFIKYFPEINDEAEKQLLINVNSEAGMAIDEESFEKKMIKILQNDHNIPLDKEEIKEFSKNVTTESIDTAEKWGNAKLTQETLSVLEKMSLSFAEKNERKIKIQQFFSWNKSFWQPHLSIIIEHLLNGDNYESEVNVDSIYMIQRRINLWMNKDVISHLRELQKSPKQLLFTPLFMEADDKISRLFLEAELIGDPEKILWISKNWLLQDVQEKISTWAIQNSAWLPNTYKWITIRPLDEIVQDIKIKRSLDADFQRSLNKELQKWPENVYRFIQRSFREWKISRITT